MNSLLRSLTLLAVLALPALTQTVQPAPKPGHWEGALQLPSGKLDLLLDLRLKDGAWQGALTIPAQGVKDLSLTGVGVAGGKLRFALPGIPGDPRFEGTIAADGQTVTGPFSQGGARLPLTLRYAGEAPLTAAPAGPIARPGERLVQFPGFNGFPLNGTVLAGGSHPYFAVMVAGSGPTDRDWSNPLIPMPSHAGRDVADWLRAQGIGSLRYDKRFIGSKDPKLDISLDAQAGDIKAAIAEARRLPEAKGKKILLVGHSEGALLSLVVADHADALLLLSMPEMSIGKVILAQVQAQLTAAGAPAEVSATNMGYLESVLDTIRRNQPLPAAPSGVAPGIVALVKALTFPENLGFERETLYLDPWALAARLSEPSAIVWGDHDVQTWRPPTVPTSYHGLVLDLPDANHLLKRETRPRGELNGATAMTAYGDKTPMADLTPVAEWLKTLK